MRKIIFLILTVFYSVSSKASTIDYSLSGYTVTIIATCSTTFCKLIKDNVVVASFPPSAGLYTYTKTLPEGSHSYELESWESNQGGTRYITSNYISFNLTNSAPVISSIGNKTINEDGVTGNIAFTVSDAETASSLLSVSTTSSDTSLIDNSGIILGGSGSSRTINLRPKADKYGSSSISISVSDGKKTSKHTFILNVTPVNDLPEITTISDKVIDEDSGISVNFKVVDKETIFENLHFSVRSSNQSIIKDSDIIINVLTGQSILYSHFILTPIKNTSGTLNITFSAYDGSGISEETFTLTVTEKNDPPKTNNISITTNEDVTVTKEVSIIDLDGDSTTLHLVSQPEQGLVSVSGKSLIYSPPGNWHGSTSFKFRARDIQGAYGAESTASVTVNAVNDPPIIESISDKQIDEDAGISVNFRVTDDTKAFENLNFSVSSSNQSLIKDGDIEIKVLTGQAMLNSFFILTPERNISGQSVIRFSAFDGEKISNEEFILTVVPVNDPPVTNNVSLNTNEDVAITKSISISDLEGDETTLHIVNQPQYGSASVSGKKLVYTPKYNWSGTTSFEFRAKDSNGALGEISIATIIVNAVNDPPEIEAIPDKTIDEDSGISVNFKAIDQETFFDDLHFWVSSSNQGIVKDESITLNVFSGQNIPNSHFILVPETNANGQVTITFSAFDGNQVSTESFKLTVRPVNDPPETTSVSAEIDEDTNVILEPNNSDVDGDEVTLEIVSYPVKGELDSVDGTIHFTPPNNWFGTATFSYRPKDELGLSGEVKIGVVVVNPVEDLPTLENMQVNTNEDVPISRTVLATDADGDDAYVNVLAGPANGTVKTSGKLISYYPKRNWSGVDQFSVFPIDEKGNVGESGIVTLNVLAVNDPPVVERISLITKENTPVTRQLLYRDVDSSELNLSISSLPVSGQALIEQSSVTFVPEINWSGSTTFSVRVSDDFGATTFADISVRVVSGSNYSNNTLYEYDALGRLKKTVNSKEGSHIYNLDAAGNRASVEKE